ncbi:hypothetical protein NHX12_010670 [Muraenolepis orangiensis]|uniref:TLC domain-containing protein n=1 Tax=Muraenolepis orangiensis TaxID=630683 RepID=A0A9Q0DK28_9TELE|nr:hypothetical protein NHX12_010670 [Muraenolepis orangiensis]
MLLLLPLQVFCSLIGWLALYLGFSLSQRGPEWNCRLVTLSHGVFIVLLTAYVVFVDGPWPFTHAGTDNTVLQTLSLAICLGYFLFDMGWCLRYGSEGPVMLAHHAASIAGTLLPLVTGRSGCETCAVIFGSELTNPLLQSRWFLRRSGRYDSLLGDAVDVLFIALFASVRVGVGSVLFYNEMVSPRPSLVTKVGGVLMYALAWLFMVDIGRFAVKKSRAKYTRWAERRRLDGHKKDDCSEKIE